MMYQEHMQTNRITRPLNYHQMKSLIECGIVSQNNWNILPSENFYKIFLKIDNDKILIEGDKNVGCVCMFIEDLKNNTRK